MVLGYYIDVISGEFVVTKDTSITTKNTITLFVSLSICLLKCTTIRFNKLEEFKLHQILLYILYLRQK